MIVCEDVDIQKVAPQVAWGAFRNSGQVSAHNNLDTQFVIQ